MSKKNVEAIYPLSPMQQGVLFHTLYAPQAGLYVQQIACTLRGDLDLPVFQQSWQRVIDRHPVLRTLFLWERRDQPLQVVRATVELPWEYADWRELSAREQQQRIDAHLDADRTRGFDLTTAPLLRLRLTRLDATSYHLILTYHHLLLDAWSLSRLFKEVFTLYSALCQGRDLRLPTLRPYRDYISWLKQQDVAQAEDFWRRTLRGFHAATPLGVDRPALAHAAQASGYAEQRQHIPAATTEALQAAARRHRLTLNILVQGAWALLLSYYSGTDDVLFGTVVSGRPPTLPGVETMIGPFVNAVAMRVQVDRRARLVEWLHQIQAHLVELRQYEHSPLAQVQSWSEIPRGQSLFESILAFENHPVEALAHEQGIDLIIEQARSFEKTNYPLTIRVVPGSELLLWIVYDDQRFDAAAIDRLCGHFQTLLEGIGAALEESHARRLADIGLLTADERQRFQNGHTMQPADVEPRALHQIFEEQARRRPDAIALVFEDMTISYAELNRRANVLAQALMARGIGPGGYVGICLPRSVDLVVSVLAVLKAGGAYVPLDPSYPAERLHFMLDDTAAAVVLSHADLADQLDSAHSGSRAQLLCLDTEWESLAGESLRSAENPPCAVTPDDLAYIIYTSGSTGQPKGVMVEHRQITRLFATTRAWFHFDERDVWTLFHSYAFDFSVWEIWGALLHGGRLVIVPYLVSRAPERFYALLAEQGVTVLNQTPSAFRQLMQAEAQATTSQPLRLRSVIFGGEALDLQSLRPWFERHGDTQPQLVNMYGITETSVHTTYRPLRLADLDQAGSLIGPPLPDLQLYILEPQSLQPVPIGVAGELYVGGAGLARGYLGRPELTAERFIPHPWSCGVPCPEGTRPGTGPGARLYRTGDLARYLPDGDIEYLGRIDQQVKIRGFRIELGEIEAVLRQHDAVRDAVVIAREENGHKRLVAYVVEQRTTEQRNKEEDQTPPSLSPAHTEREGDPRGRGRGWRGALWAAIGGEGLTSKLQTYLKDRLPDYMVPSAFVVLDSLPLTPNGKLDRRALPAPPSDRPALETEYVPPSTAEQHALAEIWSQVLGLERIGIHDHFFALGGDSIRSIQVLALARERGLEIALPQIFQHPTIASLAEALAAATVTDAPAEHPVTAAFDLIAEDDRGRLPAGLDDAYPLTQLQLGMLFHSEASPATAIYHDIFNFQLTAPFDQPALAQAIEQLGARHPLLRTSFDLSSFSEPLQLVHRQAAIPLEVVDLRGLSSHEQAAAVKAWLEAEKQRPFDWTQPPLLRFQVHRRSDAAFELALSFHHAILDGWSVASLLMDLFQLYFAGLGQGPEPVPPPQAQFRDAVALERAVLQSEAARRYWRETLADAPVAALPRWPAEQRAEPLPPMRAHSVPLETALIADLYQLGRLAEVPIKSVLLAAHLRLLTLITGQPDIVTGMVSTIRPETADGERALGLFLNTLPLRLTLEGGTWLDLLRATFAAERSTLPFRRYPLAEIQRQRGGQPIFEALFNFTHFHVYKRLERVPQVRVHDGTVFQETNFVFETHFNVDPEQEQIHLSLLYSTAQLVQPQVVMIGEYYRRILRAMTTRPAESYRDAALLPAHELRQMLNEWNATQAAYDTTTALHRHIERQVAQTPDAIALSFEESRLSYHELNARANQLAHYLDERGIQPDELVGVCLQRSIDLVVALLAVLKVGGGYVPLDPDYPQERLHFMIEDADAPVLLTTTALARQLPAYRGQIICLDRDWPVIAQRPADNLAVHVTPDHAAYMIYTSGSTGQPKGAINTHRGIVNRLLWMQDTYGLTAADRVLQKTPYSFDVSVWEFFWPLLSGARLVIARPESHKDPEYLIDVINRERITTLHFVPSMLQAFLEAPNVESCVSLLRVICSGEALPHELQARFFARLKAELHNLYGPTEAAVDVTAWACERETQRSSVPIGRPIANTQIYLLDRWLHPVPIGVAGELHIGGVQLARGYHRRPALTAEKFAPHPFSDTPGSRLYRTGDLARYLPDGTIDYLGRIDHQIKVRGFRVELGEIESVLRQHEAVREAVVMLRVEPEPQLVAYVVTNKDAGRPLGMAPGTESSTANDSGSLPSVPCSPQEFRAFLGSHLPDYMVPGAFVLLDALPLTPNGKLDRTALAALDARPDQAQVEYVMPQTTIERTIAAVWQDVLRVEQVGLYDNFFDLGGHSLLLIQARSRLREALSVDLPMTDLFRYPTIHSLARHLADPTDPAEHAGALPTRQPTARVDRGDRIAIIGMSCAVPGAPTLEAFWANIRDGVESITFFSDDELVAAGVDRALLDDPRYVKANALLDEIERFDAGFFGYTPREAQLIDPQQRLFLEHAWAALEHAGYSAAPSTEPSAERARIGVFAGTSMNSYLLFNLYTNRDLLAATGNFQTMIASDKDFLPTRVSYKLNLKGPSINVQTACSTSLVAVHLACRSLLDGECDTALAGGVSIRATQRTGYLYEEGGIASPDGHCRAFDADAHGTVAGNGLGIVVLKRLSRAIEDGDTIYAVIRGSAINNDGALKAGYTAPAIDGQAEVIGAALANAAIDPATIGYIEAHGTGTPLGDPIEVAALNQVFRGRPPRSCAIGSVKTNVGHLDAAAGVIGLIKAALALYHEQIPPSLNFESPNPQIDFASGPLYVNTSLQPWPRTDQPRRAGVSSFGIGGTNAHVVLEEAPQLDPATSIAGSGWHLLPLAARSQEALDVMTAQLAAHLAAHPALDLADVAYTLQAGRHAFAHRRVLVCHDRDDAIEALTSRDPARLIGGQAPKPGSRGDHPLIMMFPGGGAQYVNMARDVYNDVPLFRAEVDRCCALLEPLLGFDLRALLYPPETTNGQTPPLSRTSTALPALFVIEYALAQLWMSWGIQPVAMIGHSLGEYVAATLAGVFSLEDALALVVRRGQLFEQLPAGAMLSIALPEQAVLDLLRSVDARDRAIAAVNGPELCVVSGPVSAIEELTTTLTARGIEWQRLHIDVAAHSPMVEAIQAEFTAFVATLTLHAPRTPFVSNVSGTWITAAEATDPDYWGRHLRRTVRFAAGLEAIVAPTEAAPVLLEVGPGQTLSALARMQPGYTSAMTVIHSLRRPYDRQSDWSGLLEALGRVWIAGGSPDWSALHPLPRRRVPLPTYPFERGRYWIEPQPIARDGTSHSEAQVKSDIADWFYIPSWQRTLQPRAARIAADAESVWLIFADQIGLGEQIAAQIRSRQGRAITVATGARFARHDGQRYTLDPRRSADYETLIAELREHRLLPQKIIHAWTVTPTAPSTTDAQHVERTQDHGFYSVIRLAQAFEQAGITAPIEMLVVANHLHTVTGSESIDPAKATVLAPCLILPQESPQITCRSVDVALPDAAPALARLADQLIAELTAARPSEPVVAYRGEQRWTQRFAAERLEPGEPMRLRERGVYLITGGLGGIGLVLADELARTLRAKLILVGRTALPERERWPDWLATYGDDPISRKLRAVEALEAHGAEVLIASADVSDQQQMAAVVRHAEQSFGAIHGVIHAAGLAGGGLIQLKTSALADPVLAPKVQGTLVLDAIFADRALDFMLLCSSLSTILGGLGQVDYCAANLFLDAYAHVATARRGNFTLAINWDRWQQIGMAAPLEAEHLALAGSELTGGISTTAGCEAFRRALCTSGAAQIVVATRDLDRLIARSRQVSATRLLEALDQMQRSGAAHPRPNLETEYIAPRNEHEQIIAEIWQSLLGIERIAVHDNFFELGGHSLLASRIVARIRDAVQVELPLRALFEQPTIAGLAAAVADLQRTRQESASFEAILQEIESLSDDAILHVLDEARRDPPRKDSHESTL
ncbi:MAG TPA: amino acid adenylation domain-containing protein [Herpetosiphonaceae bacterium]